MESESCATYVFLPEKLHFSFYMIGLIFSIREKGYDVKNRKKIIDRRDHLINYTNKASLPLYPDKANIDGST